MVFIFFEYVFAQEAPSGTSELLQTDRNNTFLNGGNGLFIPERRLEFGKHLLRSGHAMKAEVEFLSLSNSPLFNEKTKLLIDLSKIEQNSPLQEILFPDSPLIRYAIEKKEFEKKLLTIHPATPASEAQTWEATGSEAQTWEAAGSYRESNISGDKLSLNVIKLRILEEIKNGNLSEESRGQMYLFGENEATFLKDNLEKRVSPVEKSPLLAGVLSAVLPGAGRLYTGNYGDAFSSLLLTGIFGYLAYENFSDGYIRSGVIFSAITAFFYGGNVYGSVVSAKIFNQTEREHREKELLKFYQNEKPLDEPLDLLEGEE